MPSFIGAFGQPIDPSTLRSFFNHIKPDLPGQVSDQLCRIFDDIVRIFDDIVNGKFGLSFTFIDSSFFMEFFYCILTGEFCFVGFENGSADRMSSPGSGLLFSFSTSQFNCL